MTSASDMPPLQAETCPSQVHQPTAAFFARLRASRGKSLIPVDRLVRGMLIGRYQFTKATTESLNASDDSLMRTIWCKFTARCLIDEVEGRDRGSFLSSSIATSNSDHSTLPEGWLDLPEVEKVRDCRTALLNVVATEGLPWTNFKASFEEGQPRTHQESTLLSPMLDLVRAELSLAFALHPANAQRRQQTRVALPRLVPIIAGPAPAYAAALSDELGVDADAMATAIQHTNTPRLNSVLVPAIEEYIASLARRPVASATDKLARTCAVLYGAGHVESIIASILSCAEFHERADAETRLELLQIVSVDLAQRFCPPSVPGLECGNVAIMNSLVDTDGEADPISSCKVLNALAEHATSTTPLERRDARVLPRMPTAHAAMLAVMRVYFNSLLFQHILQNGHVIAQLCDEADDSPLHELCNDFKKQLNKGGSIYKRRYLGCDRRCFSVSALIQQLHISHV